MNQKKGFALLIAIVTTSILLLVSFFVINIALKELILSYSGQESQYAFYNADSGVECAIYWDVKNPSGTSSFSTSTPGSVTCNGQGPISTGGGGNNPTSTFQINFSHGCAIVSVTKDSTVGTIISSRGYNDCTAGDSRRFERGVTTTYK